MDNGVNNLTIKDLIMLQLSLIKSFSSICIKFIILPIHSRLLILLEFLKMIMHQITLKRSVSILIVILIYKLFYRLIKKRSKIEIETIPRFVKLTKFFKNKLFKISFDIGLDHQKQEINNKTKILENVNKLLDKSNKENNLFKGLMKYYIVNYNNKHIKNLI